MNKTIKAASDNKTEFWEASFIEKQTMWGFTPANSALIAKDLLVQKGIKEVLIPGIGYGRNAAVFKDSGIVVTGIEISKTAIDIARAHYGSSMKIHHGSVVEMPFDNRQYGGIFCYALIHLLNNRMRKKLISDCYKQLKTNGYMVFTAISTDAPSYGRGKQLSKDRFESANGVKLFFYNSESIRREFSQYGLIDFFEIEEIPGKSNASIPPYMFWFIQCRRSNK